MEREFTKAWGADFITAIINTRSISSSLKQAYIDLVNSVSDVYTEHHCFQKQNNLINSPILLLFSLPLRFLWNSEKFRTASPSDSCFL
jgi:hypothetical protein